MRCVQSCEAQAYPSYHNFYGQKTPYCVPCTSSTCLECSENGESQICLKCADSLIPLGEECLEKCPYGYFNENQSCSKCS